MSGNPLTGPNLLYKATMFLSSCGIGTKTTGMNVRAMGLGAGTKTGFGIKLTKLDLFCSAANMNSETSISNTG